MTPAQLVVLKAAIAAETAPVFVAYRAGGNTGEMADWYNLASTIVVWRSTTATSDVLNALNGANMTPVDVPDGTQLWANRALACQGKQSALNVIVGGQTSVATGKANIRASLQDSLTNLPAGVGGAMLGAGWAAVRTAIQRFATSAEKLFASGGAGTAASPSDLAFEGGITNSDVLQALAS